MVLFAAYKILLKSPTIKEYVQNSNKFKGKNIWASIDHATLTGNTINVGIQNNGSVNKKKPVKVVKKNTSKNKKKISVGKGAIDGFFKLQKK